MAHGGLDVILRSLFSNCVDPCSHCKPGKFRFDRLPASLVKCRCIRLLLGGSSNRDQQAIPLPCPQSQGPNPIPHVFVWLVQRDSVLLINSESTVSLMKSYYIIML